MTSCGKNMGKNGSGVGRPFRRQESICQGTDRELKVAALTEHGSDAKPALAGAASLSSRSVAANSALARPRFANLDQEPPARAPGQGTSCRATLRPTPVYGPCPARRVLAVPAHVIRRPLFASRAYHRRPVEGGRLKLKRRRLYRNMVSAAGPTRSGPCATVSFRRVHHAKHQQPFVGGFVRSAAGRHTRPAGRSKSTAPGTAADGLHEDVPEDAPGRVREPGARTRDGG